MIKRNTLHIHVPHAPVHTCRRAWCGRLQVWRHRRHRHGVQRRCRGCEWLGVGIVTRVWEGTLHLLLVHAQPHTYFLLGCAPSLTHEPGHGKIGAALSRGSHQKQPRGWRVCTKHYSALTAFVLLPSTLLHNRMPRPACPASLPPTLATRVYC